jgi:hypothetical protein
MFFKKPKVWVTRFPVITTEYLSNFNAYTLKCLGILCTLFEFVEFFLNGRRETTILNKMKKFENTCKIVQKIGYYHFKTSV